MVAPMRGTAAAMTLFCALLLIGGTPARASDYDQTWLALAANGAVKEDSRWHFWFDAHARSRNDSSKLGVSILRPAIGFRLDNGTRLWAGYARVVGRRPGPDGEENRYWQQATYAIGNVLGGRLSGRTRLEQRTFEGASDTGHRIRQFFRWARPLGPENWFLVAYNETFIGFNDTDFGQTQGYQQNRAYLGVGWQFEQGTRVELTYLNNHLEPDNGGSFANHNLSLALFRTW